MTGKYLITTDSWFTAPDGNDYKAVWGEVSILEDNVLGLKTNRNSTNWYAKIGTEEKHVIVAGCQIHYASKSDEEPFTRYGETWETFEGKAKTYQTPTKIYIAE